LILAARPPAASGWARRPPLSQRCLQFPGCRRCGWAPLSRSHARRGPVPRGP